MENFKIMQNDAQSNHLKLKCPTLKRHMFYINGNCASIYFFNIAIHQAHFQYYFIKCSFCACLFCDNNTFSLHLGRSPSLRQFPLISKHEKSSACVPFKKLCGT